MTSVSPFSLFKLKDAQFAASRLLQGDPEKAKEADKIKQALQQVVASAKQGKNDGIAQRKAMAAQKLARIKEALKSLKQFAGADPKIIARAARQLAKELASAIKDYAAAGASASEIAASSSPASEVTSSLEQKPAEESGENSVPPEGPPADPIFSDGVKAYEKRQQIDAAALTREDPDGSFKKEAQDILNELRGFIKNIRARIKNDKSPEAKDITDAEKSLEEATKSLREMSFQST